MNGLRDVGTTMVNPHVRGAPCRDMGSEWARMGPNGPEWALPNRANGPTAMDRLAAGLVVCAARPRAEC